MRKLACFIVLGSAVAGCGMGTPDVDLPSPGPPIDEAAKRRIMRAGATIDERCNPLYTRRDGMTTMAQARHALEVLVREHRRSPVAEFTIEDDLGPDTKSSPQDALEDVVVIALDTECDALAHKARTEIFRSASSLPN